MEKEAIKPATIFFQDQGPVPFHLFHKWNRWSLEVHTYLKDGHTYESGIQIKTCRLCGFKKADIVWRNL